MHQRVINLREAYNSSLSANLNETIRTLTLIATIILPLTLITGIYGMNFDVMPELHSSLGYYYALSWIAAVAGGMIVYSGRKNGFEACVVECVIYYSITLLPRFLLFEFVLYPAH